MTPAARVAAAIECLDRILDGAPAEKTLTTFARGNRYAGSKDRRALRDLVFDALRNRRSYAWVGGGESGRQIMLGARHLTGDVDAIFSGEGYAPPPASEAEFAAFRSLETAPTATRLDVPDWVLDMVQSEGLPETEATLAALKARAPVMLRVNRLKGSLDEAMSRLEDEGIATQRHDLSASALEVTDNAQKLAQSDTYQSGLVELQDVASQAAVDHFSNALPDARVLDYCAGGGGKSLAMAAFQPTRIDAHDANPARMSDIPARAERAGAVVNLVTDVIGDYDVVLCDCPCSGSGAWRRQPEAKWTTTPEKLAELTRTQDAILARAARHVATDGVLVHATCSLFACENEDRVQAFLDQNPTARLVSSRRFSPLEGGDGFYVAVIALN